MGFYSEMLNVRLFVGAIGDGFEYAARYAGRRRFQVVPMLECGWG